MSQTSPAQLLASLTEAERNEQLSKLSDKEKAALKWHWPFWARPNQLVPDEEGDWSTWLILAGRGFGKTRTGSETIRSWVCGDTPLGKGKCGHIALVAETSADARDVMVEGESGLLAVHPPDFRPTYYPSKRLVEWPNGARAWLYNATEPDQLRGPQHDAAWLDELAKFQYMQDTWDQLQFGMRLGDNPRSIITTTPRPLPLLKKLLVDPSVVTTRGSTYDNFGNLPQSYIRNITDSYEGTRLGRQELEGEILDDVPGALWKRSDIDTYRLLEAPDDLERVVVSVDPATSANEGSNETGIVVTAMARNSEGYAEGYVLEDGTISGSPEEWANKAVSLYRKWRADRIVAEKNQGGEMVSSVLRAVDRSVPIKLVHASRGKVIRAEPISALYEQGRIHHVGRHDKLEDQMCTFSQDNMKGMASPDRVDALVWGLTELFDKVTGFPKRVRYKGNVEDGSTYTVKYGTLSEGHNSNSSSASWMQG